MEDLRDEIEIKGCLVGKLVQNRLIWMAHIVCMQGHIFPRQRHNEVAENE